MEMVTAILTYEQDDPFRLALPEDGVVEDDFLALPMPRDLHDRLKAAQIAFDAVQDEVVALVQKRAQRGG